MASFTRFPGLPLLKAFDGALKEGLLLDEALGGILTAALHFFDAPVVSLLPGAGVPPMTRSGRSSVAAAAEARLNQHLSDVLAQGRPKKVSEGGLSFFGAPVKVKDQVQAVLGVVMETMPAGEAEAEEAIRLFARSVGHVLERERTLGTLMKTARGGRRPLRARLRGVPLPESRRGHPPDRRVSVARARVRPRDGVPLPSRGARGHGDPPPGRHDERRAPDVPARPLAADELLGRALSAHGPAFEDEPGSTPTRRRRMCLPLHAGDLVFGFLTMSRRGGFALTPQELRLAQELAKLAAGALDKARLLEAERRHGERNAFVGRLHTALSGQTDVATIAARTVDELGPQFDFDVCVLRLLPAGELPGTQAAFVKGGGNGDRGRDLEHARRPPRDGDLPSPAPRRREGPARRRAPAVGRRRRDSSRPRSAFSRCRSCTAARPRASSARSPARARHALSTEDLRSFEALGVEVSLAITSARLLQQERESYRFLDRLREVGRSLATTFDVDRIKQTLCEQSVTLLKADAAQFWDADPASKSAKISTRWGADVGDEVGRAVAFEQTGHPIVRTFLDKTMSVAGPAEGATFFPGNASGANGAADPRGRRAAHVPRRAHRRPLGRRAARRRRLAGGPQGAARPPRGRRRRSAPQRAPHEAHRAADRARQPVGPLQPVLARQAPRVRAPAGRAQRPVDRRRAPAHGRPERSDREAGHRLRRLPHAEARREARAGDARSRTSSRATRTTASTSSSSRRARCRRIAPSTRSRRTSSKGWTSGSSPPESSSA